MVQNNPFITFKLTLILCLIAPLLAFHIHRPQLMGSEAPKALGTSSRVARGLPYTKIGFLQPSKETPKTPIKQAFSTYLTVYPKGQLMEVRRSLGESDIVVKEGGKKLSQMVLVDPGKKQLILISKEEGEGVCKSDLMVFRERAQKTQTKMDFSSYMTLYPTGQLMPVDRGLKEGDIVVKEGEKQSSQIVLVDLPVRKQLVLIAKEDEKEEDEEVCKSDLMVFRERAQRKACESEKEEEEIQELKETIRSLAKTKLAKLVYLLIYAIRNIN